MRHLLLTALLLLLLPGHAPGAPKSNYRAWVMATLPDSAELLARFEVRLG